MKYTSEIEIDAPRDTVVRLFSDIGHYPDWQPTFVQMEPIKGSPGQTGAETRLWYQMGKRNIEMVETIRKNDLPDAFEAIYDAKNVHNVQLNFFEELPGDKTRWRADSEFKFSGLFMKMISFLMPGAFKKQTRSNMSDFKAFVEKEIAR